MNNRKLYHVKKACRIKFKDLRDLYNDKKGHPM